MMISFLSFPDSACRISLVLRSDAKVGVDEDHVFNET